MISVQLSLKDIISKSSDLPSMSGAALKVVRLADHPSCSSQHLAQILAHDPSLSARVLRLANSAYYGFARKVTNLSDAVIAVGNRDIKNIALVAASYPFLNKAVKGFGLGPKQLWEHSFAMAAGTEAIARECKKFPPSDGFTAGLLCDIGKVAISVWFETKLAAMLQLAKGKDVAFDEIERQILGYDHADVGAYLAETWNLPASLISPIKNHHRPNSVSPPDPIVDGVHLADYLAMLMGYGLGADGLRYEFQVGALERLGINAAGLDKLIEQIVDSVTAYGGLFQEVDE